MLAFCAHNNFRLDTVQRNFTKICTPLQQKLSADIKAKYFTNICAPYRQKLSVDTMAHCSIFNKEISNAMNAHEYFIRIGYYLAQIDKNLNFLGHICII